jgi:hypothetical protein
MEMYQDNYVKQTKDEYDKINYSAWMHGQYIIPAIQVALDPKKAKYPKKPYNNQSEVDEEGYEVDAYEKFRRSMRGMNERIKENKGV